jgi:hypothetical protein
MAAEQQSEARAVTGVQRFAAALFFLLGLDGGLKAEEALGEDPFHRFYALQQAGDHRGVAALLQELIHEEDMFCGVVTDYQVVERSARRLGIKLRCTGMPLYGVRLQPEGAPVVFGGDGMIAPFSNVDGAVIAITAPAAEVAAASPLRDGGHPASAQQEKSAWLMFSLIANIVVLAALGLFAWGYFRRSSFPLSRDDAQRLSSADKDILIAQAVEVAPRIHKHPAGVYLAKGRHGKRRLFRHLIAAMLYRDLGIKWGELK